MQQAEFEALFDSTVEACRGLLITKGREYAGTDDRLANFKRGASLTGCTPLQVLFIYLSKHYDAVATFVRDEAAFDSAGSARPQTSEPIEGRLDDLINYAILAKALIVESEQKPNPECPHKWEQLPSGTLHCLHCGEVR
jgi:hypothetical protein